MKVWGWGFLKYLDEGLVDNRGKGHWVEWSQQVKIDERINN